MSKGYLQAEIDKIRIVDKFTSVLDGEYLRQKLEAKKAAQEASEAPSQGTKLAA